MPTQAQAGVYSAVTHYLKAVDALGSDEAKAVVAKMRDTPIHDFFADHGQLRVDGRMVHDMYLVASRHGGRRTALTIARLSSVRSQ